MMIKIVDDRKPNKLVPFEQLNYQDVFEIPNLDGIFMKVPLMDRVLEQDHVAIRLSSIPNNPVEYFITVEDWVEVIPLEAELHVKRKNKEEK